MIGDEAVDALTQIRSLRRINLLETSMSNEAVKRLRAMMPQVVVRRLNTDPDFDQKQIAAEREMDVAQRAVPAEELRSAGELFLTSTAGGIIPVTAVDGIVVGDGLPGPVTAALHASYWNRRAQGWLGEAVNYDAGEPRPEERNG